MADDDSVFYFIDGLQNWAKQEFQRRGVRSLADSLYDFTTNDRSKSYKRRDGCSEKGRGDARVSRLISPRRDKRGSSS